MRENDHYGGIILGCKKTANVCSLLKAGGQSMLFAHSKNSISSNLS
nr:MAG TPA_asm: hypothetical protein [Caudoviricetes sp.]